MQARIKIKHDTTENWNNAHGFIPMAGEIIVYDDYQTKEYTVVEGGETITRTRNVPGIKIGTGNGYVQDLAFVDEKTYQILIDHINNEQLHVTLGEKAFWNNKVNIDDAYETIHEELEDEVLIFNRN